MNNITRIIMVLVILLTFQSLSFANNETLSPNSVKFIDNMDILEGVENSSDSSQVSLQPFLLKGFFKLENNLDENAGQKGWVKLKNRQQTNIVIFDGVKRFVRCLFDTVSITNIIAGVGTKSETSDKNYCYSGTYQAHNSDNGKYLSINIHRFLDDGVLKYVSDQQNVDLVSRDSDQLVNFPSPYGSVLAPKGSYEKSQSTDMAKVYMFYRRELKQLGLAYNIKCDCFSDISNKFSEKKYVGIQ